MSASVVVWAAQASVMRVGVLKEWSDSAVADTTRLEPRATTPVQEHLGVITGAPASHWLS